MGNILDTTITQTLAETGASIGKAVAKDVDEAGGVLNYVADKATALWDSGAEENTRVTAKVNKIVSKYTPIKQAKTAGYDDDTIVNSIISNAKTTKDVRLKLIKAKKAGYDSTSIVDSIIAGETKEIDMAKAGLPFFTDSNRLNDLQLGLHKGFIGMGRTVNDIYKGVSSATVGLGSGLVTAGGGAINAVSLIGDDEYNSLDKEYQNDIRNIEKAVVDKDVLSMETLGEVGSSFAVPAGTTGKVKELANVLPKIKNLSAIAQGRLATGLVTAIAGYNSNRTSEDSTVGGSLAVGAGSGLVFGAGGAVIKQIPFIKYLGETGTKLAYNKIVKTYNIAEDTMNEVLSEYHKVVKPSDSIYKDKLNAIVHSRILEKQGDALLADMADTSTSTEMGKVADAFREGSIDRKSIYKGMTQGNVYDALDNVNTLLTRTGDNYGKFTSSIEDKVVIQGRETVDSITTNSAKAQKFLDDEIIKLRIKKNSTRPNSTEAQQLDKDLEALRISKSKLVSDTKEKLANTKSLGSFTPEELLGNGIVPTAKKNIQDIYNKPNITITDTMELVKNLNSILGTNLSNNEKRLYNKQKSMYNDVIKKNMSEADFDKWVNINKDYAIASQVKAHKLGEAIDKITRSSTAEAKNAELSTLITKLPSILKDTSDDISKGYQTNNVNLFTNIEHLVGSSKARVFENHIIDLALDTDNILNTTNSLSNQQIASVVSAGNNWTGPEGKAIQSISQTINKAFRLDDKSFITSNKGIFQDIGVRSHAINMIGAEGVKWAIVMLKRNLTSRGQVNSKLQKALSNKQEVNKLIKYIENMPVGVKEEVQELMIKGATNGE